ncbi:single-stranded DNA-binding protein [Candidatus Gracilibacteria bacterium]|nr:single-stranded DNA-binding protein [Candidatus Gracilibacteria bacterium]
MNSLNKAEIIGNITRDPELKTTGSNQSVTTIGVATNRNWTDSNGQKHEEAEFHNVVCWGKLAEIVCQYLNKGAKVYFSGRLRTRNWEDTSGVKHYRTEIVAQDMIMLSPRGGGGGGSGDESGQSYDDNAPEPDNGPDEEISAEDLPF